MVGEREERRKVLIEWGGRRNRWIHKRKWLVTLVSFYFCEKKILSCEKSVVPLAWLKNESKISKIRRFGPEQSKHPRKFDNAFLL